MENHQHEKENRQKRKRKRGYCKLHGAVLRKKVVSRMENDQHE